jgi:hypothetical protein
VVVQGDTPLGKNSYCPHSMTTTHKKFVQVVRSCSPVDNAWRALTSLQS